MADLELQTRKTGDLIGDLVRQAEVLLRAEVRLARIDLREAAKRAAERALRTAAAAVLMHAGVLLVAAALFLGLRTVLPDWGAALIAGALFICAGALLLRRSGTTETKEIHTWTSETASNEKPKPPASA